MSDEEFAKEWIKDHSGLIGSYEFVKYDYDSMLKAVLAGLKAGREKEWHFVKNGDLPEKSDSTLRTLRPVFVAVKSINGLKCCSYGTYWNIQAGKFECLDEVYAWCDVPEPPVPRPPKE